MKEIKNRISKILILANRIGFLHLLSANLLIQVAGFGGQIFLTRILNVDEIGTIKIYQAYLNILVVLASLGLNTAVLKLCSEDINNTERINIFNISLIFSFLFSSILVFVSFFFTNDKLFNSYLMLVPILSLTNLIVVYLQSRQKIKSISFIQSFSKIFIVLFTTIFAYLIGFKGYIHSLILLNLVTFLLILPFIKNELQNIKKIKFNSNEINKIKKIAFFAFGANLLGVLLININIIIATYYQIDKKEIAYFSMAQLIISTMMIIPATLGQIMIPKISKCSNNKEEVKVLFKNYHHKNILIAMLIALAGSILGPIFIPLVFGEVYIKSIFYFELLLIGFIFWSYFSPKGITLLSIGRSDLNFYVSLISLIVNVTMNIVLIKYYGLIGAVITAIVTNFFTIFVNEYFFSKEFKVKV